MGRQPTVETQQLTQDWQMYSKGGLVRGESGAPWDAKNLHVCMYRTYTRQDRQQEAHNCHLLCAINRIRSPRYLIRNIKLDAF